MIKLTEEEKELINKYKSALQKNDLGQFYHSLSREGYIDEDVIINILQCLVDTFENKIFNYFKDKKITDSFFSYLDLSALSPNGVLTIPDSVKLGRICFSEAYGFHTVILGTPYIGIDTFDECENLKKCIITKPIKKHILEDCTILSDCKNITDITVCWKWSDMKKYNKNIKTEEDAKLYLLDCLLYLDDLNQSQIDRIEIHWS